MARPPAALFSFPPKMPWFSDPGEVPHPVRSFPAWAVSGGEASPFLGLARDLHHFSAIDLERVEHSLCLSLQYRKEELYVQPSRGQSSVRSFLPVVWRQRHAPDVSRFIQFDSAAHRVLRIDVDDLSHGALIRQVHVDRDCHSGTQLCRSCD
jgi:hypothetical protein